jgi:hypothetical protein
METPQVPGMILKMCDGEEKQKKREFCAQDGPLIVIAFHWVTKDVTSVVACTSGPNPRYKKTDEAEDNSNEGRQTDKRPRQISCPFFRSISLIFYSTLS